MAAKVKYPIRAALARFLPIRNHLVNVEHYLFHAGHDEFVEQISAIRMRLIKLQDCIESLKEKQGKK